MKSTLGEFSVSCGRGDAALGLYGALQEEQRGAKSYVISQARHPGRHMQSTCQYMQIAQALPGVPHLRVSL